MSNVFESVYGYRHALLAAIALSLLIRLQALSDPMYSLDAYYHTYVPKAAGMNWVVISHGRYGQLLLLYLRDLFGLHGLGYAPVLMMFSIILFVLAGLLFAAAQSGGRVSQTEAFMYIAVFTLHPFQAQYFHYATAVLDVAIAFIVAAGAAWFAINARSVRAAIGLGGGLTILAASMYQVAIAPAMVVCLFAVVRQMSDPKTEIHGWRGFAIIIASMTLYILSIQVVFNLTKVEPDGRATLDAILGLQQRNLIFITNGALSVIMPKPGLLPMFGQLAVAMMCIISAAAVIWSRMREQQPLQALMVLVILVLAFACAISPAVLGGDFHPRIVIGALTFISGLLLLGWHAVPQLRPHLAACTAVALVTFLAGTSQVQFDQRRITTWDAQKVNRIIARLETHPDFPKIRTVVFRGGNYDNSKLLPTGMINNSALPAFWTTLPLIEAWTGYRLAEPTKEDRETATKYCANNTAWPATASVAIIEAVGVVCLGN